MATSNSTPIYTNLTDATRLPTGLIAGLRHRLKDHCLEFVKVVAPYDIAVTFNNVAVPFNPF